MKPITNFHTHTQLCKHASGMPQDFLNQALKENCSELGFSDHCPYNPAFYDFWPHIRMDTDEAKLYISSITQLKESAPIPVYLGYECEWDSNFSSWYSEDLRSTFKADYLVLGSHWVTEGSNHIYILDVDDNKLLNKYIDQTIKGMQSGNFSFLAHPDLFMAKYKIWDEQSMSCAEALIDAAKDLDIPLEINGLGMKRPLSDTINGMRFAYPYVEFWEMVADKKAKVICNSDAHEVKDLIINAWKARDFAGRFNLSPVNSIFK